MARKRSQACFSIARQACFPYLSLAKSNAACVCVGGCVQGCLST